MLEEFFERNAHPTYSERQHLAGILRTNQRSVQIWFQNQRAKYKSSNPRWVRTASESVAPIHPTSLELWRSLRLYYVCVCCSRESGTPCLCLPIALTIVRSSSARVRDINREC